MVPPVIAPELVGSATDRVRGLIDRVGSTADAVGDRFRPAPPAPGLRAVRDA
jgi:UDP-glucose 4-epimerase